jgi:hypothetical protein
VENVVLGLACGLLFGVRLSDLGPFRAIRRDLLVRLGVADRGQGWPLEMVGRAALAGLRVVEVPVRYHRRAGGRSKVGGSLTGSLRAAAHMTGVAGRLMLQRAAGRLPDRRTLQRPANREIT